MNRRRAPSAGRKKTAKRHLATRATQEKNAARRRPARKNGLAKKAAASATARRKLPKRALGADKPARPKAGSRRAQNRRRPVAKPSKDIERPMNWRERARAARENLEGWCFAHRKGFVRAGQALLIAAGIAGLVWLGHLTVVYAHTAQAFAIRDVVVEGNNQLEDIDVRRAAQVQVGSNIFEVSAEESQKRLLQHPWVEDATVVRKLPGRVRIEIIERKPVALVALDQLYLVSDQGAVFKRLGVDDPVDLPVITGIASERFYDDFDYRTEVLLASMALLQDYEGAGLATREPVSEIHFDGANGIELFVGADGMNVRLGTGQHRQKLRRFRRILERLAREKTRPSYVYLDNVRSPERVTVRLP